MIESNKLLVPLCKDHFERLCNGNVCSTCPNKVENEKLVIAIAKVMEDEKKVPEIAIKELALTRAEINEIKKKLIFIEKSLLGNGQPGLKDRVLALEKEKEAHEKSSNKMLQMAGVIAAILLGLLGIFI